MKKKFNIFGVIAISGAAALVLMNLNGCGKLELEKKTITLKRFMRVEPGNFSRIETDNLAVTADKNHIYLTTNGGQDLYHGDASNIEKGWTKMDFAKALKDKMDDSAGQAKLEKADKVTAISAGRDGALVSVNDTVTSGTATKDNGVFHVVGKDEYKAAWRASAQDVNANATAAAGKMNVNTNSIKGMIIITADGTQVPYIAGEDAAGSEFAVVTKADLTPAKIDLAVSIGSPADNFASMPKNTIAGQDHLFAVSDLGVTAVPADQIGQAVNFPEVAANTPANADGRVGSGAFKMDSGVNNDSVISVMVAGDKLYIGLNSDGATAKTGGVAVYQMKSGEAPTVTAPDVAWSKVAVNELVKDGSGTVWALAKIDGNYDLFKAMDDGKRGESYFDALMSDASADESFDTAKSGYKAEGLFADPRLAVADINGAAFVGDALLLSTDKGLIYLESKDKDIPGTKLVGKAE